MAGPYPTYAEIKARQLAERREAAMRALGRADEVVRAAGGRMIVFGSLAENRFHQGSDIDLALFGLPAPLDAQVETRVFLICEEEGFEADVIAERFLSPSLRQRVISRGKELSSLA